MSTGSSALQCGINNLLNARERALLRDVLETYQVKRNVRDLARSLDRLLDTPAKKELTNSLRSVIPTADLRLFDQLTAELFAPRRVGDNMTKGVDARDTVRMPMAYYDTVPARRANNTPRRPLAHVARPHSAAEIGASPPSRTVHLCAQTDAGSRHKGRRGKLGFSIRGGAEHGMGIFVSSVDEGSVAEKQDLAAGDEIYSVNHISFKNISQDEAVRILRSHKRLTLEVRTVGQVPAALESTYTYTWVDPRGRVVSPPPATETLIDWDDSTVGRRSGLNLLNGSDERKVNLAVGAGSPLGIKVRGGREFGLGIFVTGVDRGSAAELGGLKVGEQILDVNGESFLNITHCDAVAILQGSRHLVMTTRDIGKLPLARTTYEHAQWTECDCPVTQHAGDTFTYQRKGSGRSKGRNGLKGIFQHGAGSQLTHSALANISSPGCFLEDTARRRLSRDEHTSFTRLLKHYQQGNVSVYELATGLCKLLDTPAKYSLAKEVRGLIAPLDLELFDSLLMEKEVDELAASMTRLPEPADPPFDCVSYSPSDRSRCSSSSGVVAEASTDEDDNDDADTLTHVLDQMRKASTTGNVRQTHREHHPSYTEGSSEDSFSDKAGNLSLIHVEVHTPPQTTHRSAHAGDKTSRGPGQRCEETRSEDSGVDVANFSNRQRSRAAVGRHSNNFSDLDRNSEYQEIATVNGTPERHLPGPRIGSDESLRDLVVAVNGGHDDMTFASNHKRLYDSDIHRRKLTTNDHGNTKRGARYTINRRQRAKLQADLFAAPEQDVDNTSRSWEGSDPGKSMGVKLSQNGDNEHLSNDSQTLGQCHPGETDDPLLAAILAPPPEFCSQPSNTGSSDVTGKRKEPSRRHLRMVVIRKTRPSLGFSIEGGADTRIPLPKIVTIQPDGSAGRCSDLKEGQVIIEVNGQPLENLTHRQCARAIAHAYKHAEDSINLIVAEHYS